MARYLNGKTQLECYHTSSQWQSRSKRYQYGMIGLELCGKICQWLDTIRTLIMIPTANGKIQYNQNISRTRYSYRTFVCMQPLTVELARS